MIKSKIEQCLKNVLRTKFDNFITVWERPAMSDAYQIESKFHANVKVGIVIQGPIYLERDFTFETVKQYRKLYPEAVIVVSTWDDTPVRDVEQIRGLDVEVVLNKKPIPNGANFNLQMITSLNGILKAKELGCEYVCKTRSDHRMYAPNLFRYLINMLTSFPLQISCSAKSRIIAISANTYLTRLYGISDMWQFGHIDDMLVYWGCDPAREDDELKRYSNEQYLCASYIKKLDFELNWSEEDSLFYYANLFVVIDSQSVDLYSWKCSKEYIYKFYSNPELVEFEFRDWMALQ